MKHFGGALCFALALPSFGCGEDMNTSDTESSDGGNALPPIETCNFVDDDGDGLVDGDRRLSRPSGVEDRVDDGIGRPLSRRA